METMEKYYEHLHLRTFDAALRTAPITADSLIFTSGRKAEKLDGIWKCMPDVFDTLTRKQLFSGREKEDSNGMKIPSDYRFGDGFDAEVPGCWNFVDPAFFLYEGSTAYARHFTYYQNNEDDRVFLRIGAANYECRIFLNGEYIGRHLGGFTPFCAELTGKLKHENELMIIVNNRRSFEQVPSENYDWFNYGGITRSVALYEVPSAFIKDFQIELVPDGTFSHIKARVKAEGKLTDGVIRIPALGVEKDFTLENGQASVDIEASPVLWSPDSPVLYDVSVEAGNDRVSDRVGFREIKADGRKIMLNGKEIFLKGICCHEESYDGGRTLSDDECRQILATAKELGCNALRLTHYPHSERMSQLADEIGVMLWEEIPVYWLIDFDNPETLANARNQLKELMTRDYNRASVIIWSVGNENPDTDSRLKFMSQLADDCHAFDKTRLVSAACLVNIDKMAICDRLTGVVDIISFNQYYGWYFRNYEGLKEILDNSVVDKPLMISETGLSSQKIKGGTPLEDYEWAQLNERIKGLAKAPLYIDDTSQLPIGEFRTKARRLVQKYGVKLIIIDYLQLMIGPKELRGMREQEVAAISRSLKATAKELDIPIIALSQLNRGAVMRAGSNSRPQLNDLRESGSIEQDADIVMFVHRYDYGVTPEDPNDEGRTDIIIAKHRNGETCDIPMRFLSSEMRFVDDLSSNSFIGGARDENYTFSRFDSRMNDNNQSYDDMPAGDGF